MSKAQPQNYKNHTRLDPMWHFFLGPLFLLNFFVAIYHLVRRPHAGSVWLLVLSIGLVGMLLLVRVYPLRVQDRVIRLEERLRLAALLPESQRDHIGELSVKQLIALRFASDAELPALAERAWKENLTSDQIKLAIQNWRPDYLRV
ncbi:MAG: DUF6526 family protein [Acidobacteriaceae bacterium]